MSLGKNIQKIRKKHDMTQEQLAEKLDVSRQSVSKWESDATYPEMNTLVQLCEMFSVDMDTLLRKDVEIFYSEDIVGYDKQMTLFARLVSFAVGLILFGLSIMLLLGSRANITERQNSLATIIFFVFIIIAVLIFVVTGMQREYFVKKNPQIPLFYSEEQIDAFHRKVPVYTAGSIGIILIGLLFILGSEFLPVPKGYTDSIYVALFMFLIAIGASLLTYVGLLKDKYDIEKYNKTQTQQKGEEQQKVDSLFGKWCGCIMLIAVIVFLVTGFIWEAWRISWIVFPVGGILCGIASIILSKE